MFLDLVCVCLCCTLIDVESNLLNCKLLDFEGDI